MNSGGGRVKLEGKPADPACRRANFRVSLSTVNRDGGLG